jgi:release factor glutamine methyltransferase
VSDGPVCSVAAALARARAMGVDRLDAQLLLARVLACPRSWLLAHDDAVLDDDQTLQLHGQLARRVDGEPLAYLLGEKEFHGLTLQVNPDVLIPRPDTEVLVDWAIELLAGKLARFERPAVVDLGTGSGAIALAVKNSRPGAGVVGTDNSPAALVVAGSNALRLGLDVSLLPGSWWEPLPGQRFHLALSNPPYIAASDLHLSALRHEPTSALTPGGDGLDALRRIVRGAPQHLLPDGWLLLEHGYDQAEAVQRLLHDHGFKAVETRRDLGGQPRCTGATLSSPTIAHHPN